MTDPEEYSTDPQWVRRQLFGPDLAGARHRLISCLARGDTPAEDAWRCISQKQHALYYQLRLVLPPADAIRRAISTGE